MVAGLRESTTKAVTTSRGSPPDTARQLAPPLVVLKSPRDVPA
jgi:hypothetical protein